MYVYHQQLPISINYFLVCFTFVLTYQWCNQNFFRANILINNSSTTLERKTVQGKILEVFSPKYSLNSISNEKFNP